MNQRRPQMPPRGPRPQGPQMPPRGPQSSQGKPEYHWRRWRRWPHYWNYYDYYYYYDYYDYDYYDWYDYDYYDWDWYDWRYYGGNRQQAPARPSKMSYCFKIEPLLMGNLLEYASTTQPSQEDIQGMLDRMMDLSNLEDNQILDMEDYDMIVTVTNSIRPVPVPNIDKQ